jgi:trehalose-phosphatase
MPSLALDAAELEVALRRLALVERLLIALDFDGVLDPDAARPLAAAVAALAAAPQVTVALISGRTLADLRRLADPPPQAILVGGHGGQVAWPGVPEVYLVSAEDRDCLAALSRALHEISARYPGTAVEEKQTGVVLHTRRADPEVGRAASAEAWAGPARWSGVLPMRGAGVVDISVAAVSKGTALRALRDKTGPDPARGGALYIGDDVTDEAAFAVLDDELGDVTIKVGPGPSVARHRVSGPEDVAGRLRLLAHLRRFG